MRKGFVFLSSYFESLKGLDDDLRLKCYDVIIEYGITAQHQEITDNTVYAIFNLIKPIIDANYQRYLNGKKGGKPKKDAGQQEENNNVPEQAAEEPPKEKPKKEQQPPKTAYGVYNNVLLSDRDYELLVANKGEELTKEAILELDSYIEALSPPKKKEYKKRNHKIVMERWVFERVEEKRKQSEKVVNLRARPTNFIKGIELERPEGYYDDLEKKILDN